MTQCIYQKALKNKILNAIIDNIVKWIYKDKLKNPGNGDYYENTGFYCNCK